MKPNADPDLHRLRHSAAHLMAAAVCRLFEKVQLDIGPATDEGFYYDFELAHRLGPEDFERIEAEMARIAAEDLPFERLEVSREEAGRLIRERGQTYKLERLADIPEGEAITFYRCGEFLDLCRGPHLERTGPLRAFKLLSVAGSYYRGRETNPMLQRLYGTAHPTEKALRAHLHQIEQARLRDHRKLGRELDLFSTAEDVGPGLILWHPRGARVRLVIEDYWRRAHLGSGSEIVFTPHLGRSGLWETSGHLGFYRESMYAPMTIDEDAYYIKPMNCPFHIQIYRSRKWSYRDLPLRWAELGTVYRYEKAGALNGLFRVRGFTQDDAHIYCTPEQVDGEIRRVMRFAMDMWRAFGFADISAYLSTRPAQSVGDDARWTQATEALEKALREEGVAYEVDPGGGAFYGPKIDLRVKDAIGREWQVSTFQFDFNLPDRFDLSYVGADGREHRPYMVHRALLGSLERFFGILIEHYGGAFPLWLAPEQARVLPLTDQQLDYAEAVAGALAARDLRVTVDRRSEKLGAKIRNAQMEKIPYMLVAGAREAAEGTVAVRARTGGDLGPMTLEQFASAALAEVATRGLEPVSRPEKARRDADPASPGAPTRGEGSGPAGAET